MARFDKPCRVFAGAVGYFRERMQVGEHLTEDQTIPMICFGAGAERLGLTGTCQLSDFEAVCHGRHPATDVNLTVRTNAEHRVCCFGQLSAPQYVSSALLVRGERRIAGRWETAVRVCQGGGQTNRPNGNLVVSVGHARHQLHTRPPAVRPCLHHDRHLGPHETAMEEPATRRLCRGRSNLREVCYSRLAASMVAADPEIGPARLGFIIKGFPPRARALFTKRRQKIMKEAKAKGARQQDTLQTIAGNSRAAKLKTTAALTEIRKREAGPHLARIESVIQWAVGGRLPGGRVAVEPAALSSACDHIYERHSFVTEHEFLSEVLRVGTGVAALPHLRDERNASVAAVTLIREKDWLVSPGALAAESECIPVAFEGRNSGPELGRPPQNGGLSDDQVAAANQLCKSRAWSIIPQGDVGTGKTTSLRALVAAIRDSGSEVFCGAPPAGAAHVLRAERSPDAETLQQLLANESLQRQLNGRVVIVDETGMISIRHLLGLRRLAIAHDIRLVLVGDTKQHTAVEAGDALRAISPYVDLPVPADGGRKRDSIRARGRVGLLPAAEEFRWQSTRDSSDLVQYTQLTPLSFPESTGGWCTPPRTEAA